MIADDVLRALQGSQRDTFPRALASSIVVAIQNVAEYYYVGTPQEHWDLDDFPRIVSPWPAFWMEYRTLAAYSGCSIRWLRDRLSDLRHPLPYYRLPGGKILVRRSEFDAWLARYRHMDNPDVKRIVTDAIQRLRKPSKVPA